TREARGYEKHGEDYYFLSLDDFKHKIQHNEFVEWEMVYDGKYYGTLKAELERIWGNEQIPLLDIDVKGAIHVQQQYPDTSLSHLNEPAAIDELKKRLSSRRTESEESLQARINKASCELSFKDQFNECVLNENFELGCKEAKGIVKNFFNL